MPYLDNPAGRLHNLLERYAQHSKSAFQQAWALTLDVPTEDVPLYLGDITALMRDVTRAATGTDDPAYAPIAGHVRMLSECVSPANLAWNQPATNAAPNPTAMQSLLMFSSYLHSVGPDGDLPDAQTLADLVAQVSDLIEGVKAADIEASVKHLLLDRLAEVYRALNHLDIGGTDAARAAMDALAMTTAVYGSTVKDKDLVDKFKKTLKTLYVTFAIAVTLADGIPTLDHTYNVVHHLFDPPQAQLHLPPGPQDRRSDGPVLLPPGKVESMEDEDPEHEESS